MFEGCSNLVSLNLNHFKTENVHYMNKMFKDCLKLEVLNFSQISEKTLGTMFYNCQNLKYLNIYSLTEDVQSSNEMFEGTSDDFQLCIKKNIKFQIFFN